VALLVHGLVERARKLLSWMNQHFQSFTIQLISLRKRLSFALNQVFGDHNHVVLNLTLIYLNLATSLIILLNKTLTSSLSLTLLRLFNRGSNQLDRVTDLNSKFGSLGAVDLRVEKAGALNLVHLGHDLPRDYLVGLLHELLQLLAIERERRLVHEDHKATLELARSDELLVEGFLLLEYFALDVCVCNVRLLVANAQPNVCVLFGLTFKACHRAR